MKEEIKSSMDFDALRNRSKSPIAFAAIDFIVSIDCQEFWLDYRDRNPIDLVKFLITPTIGLAVRGHRFRDRAIMDAKGQITIHT